MSAVRADQLGVLLSSMSDGTAGALLGRSAGWVALRRAELREAASVVVVPTVPVLEPATRQALAAAAEAAITRLHARLTPGTVEVLRPVTPRRLRFCRRFLKAGWPLAEVAVLFDLAPDALAAALDADA